MSGPFVLTENGRVINCAYVAYITPNAGSIRDGIGSACVYYVDGRLKANVTMAEDYPALLAAMGLKPVEGV